MLLLYSDASYSAETKIGVATSIILDDDRQLLKAMFVKVYGNVSASSHAELLGISQGLEWLLDNAVEAEYTIACDNLSILEKISKYPEDNRVIAGPPATLWFHVFNMLDRLQRPVILHYASHQTDHNPNKACDMLSSRVLSTLGGEDKCTQ